MPTDIRAKNYLPAGQGAIIGFGIKGGKDADAKLINSVKLFSHLAKIGHAKSLIMHPATTTHSQLDDMWFTCKPCTPWPTWNTFC
jgi:O-acetylhomoserine (thiol)-lyase